MKEKNRVIDKMMTLQELFKVTKAFVEEGHELSAIIQFINEQGTEEFISIAYEATAMALALQDLKKGTTLDTWQYFLDKYGSQHAVQVYVGLGWACAQQRLDPMPFIQNAPPLLGWRIVDGYGYYDGFFRRRKVLQGTSSAIISEEGLSVYWQGVGRSFWYTCKGSNVKLEKILSQIPIEYQTDFWRGIGIASTYVGGQTLESCQEIWELAGNYQTQLKTGAALAIKSRAEANTIVKDTEMIASEWCKLSILKIIALLKNKTSAYTVENEKLYHVWIQEIDKEFDS